MDTILAPNHQSPAPLTQQPLIKVRGLRLTVPSAAGPVNILSGIDLDVAPGEAVGIVGPSGSGKTSLLMVLAGLEAATAGTVHVAGQDITGLNEDALARFRRGTVGIVFQSFHLIPTMTALENVSIPLELANQPGAQARATEALQAVGLGHRLTHLPGQLSGGEQQRVALARAFAPRPRLLLADEPTGNLDAAALQAALGIGDEDDPDRAVAALRTPEPAKVGRLPSWGQLLLLTQLAKHHPSLGVRYAGTPDTIQEPNGDRWTALRQESVRADGTVGHIVTIERTPDTFRYDEARSQKLHYEGELATALRGKATAERAAAQNLGAGTAEAARARLQEATARVEEIRAALRDLQPRLTPPETTSWRFTTEFDDTPLDDAPGEG